jgi:predicted outer membrane repeat protein
VDWPPRRPRAAVLAVAAAALASAAGPAHAANKDATCATLQTVLDGAQHTDVITLDSSDGPNGRCDRQYTLRSFPSPAGGTYNVVTLQGNPGNGVDAFDGTGLPGRILTGDDVHVLEIRNLVFQDGSATGAADAGNGGAISITGESAPAIRDSTFLNNSATGKGGAVYLRQDDDFTGPQGVALSGNTFGSVDAAALRNTSGGNGGGAAVETPGQASGSVNTNLFAGNVAGGNGGGFSWVFSEADSGVGLNLADNTVVDNTAGRSGGGGHVLSDTGGLISINRERYEGNVLELVGPGPHLPEDHFGGGLYVEHNGTLRQRNNVFRSNRVGPFSGDVGGLYGGGGQAIVGDTLSARSEEGEFIDNFVAAQPDGPGYESEGGGLYVRGPNTTYHGWLDVVAANSVGDGGEGGGVYLGAAGARLEYSDSTIAGNSVGAGGAFPGIAGGGGNDHLQLRNSIVFNTPQPDIGGFRTHDVQYSDACIEPGAPFPGAGNICSDPLLANPAEGDVHQTKASPTIDKGNDEFFSGEAEDPCCDFEGDPRPTDGDGDGHTVDMGADETPAGFAAPDVGQEQVPLPPPPPLTPQCADGVDNDADTVIDQADPGCLSGPGESYNAADANEGDEGLRELVLCGRRPLSLVRADARGRRVVLTGLVGGQLAGQRVDLFVRYLRGGGKRTKLATVTPGADGQFVARVKGPPRRLFNAARYQARVDDARSVELKLPQSLESTSIRQDGDTIELRGRVDRPLLGRRNQVVIKRVLCGQYQTVGQARPNRRGVYVVRFAAPEIALAALYRAETRVLARPDSTRYVRQFARAVSITLTGQSG